jgi:hypothetical protein
MEKRARGKAQDPQAPVDEQSTELAEVVDEQSGAISTGMEASADARGTFDDGAFEPVEAELYGRLAAPFDVTFRDLRGGVELEYITGEQATTRLNETLGFLNWSFRIVEHGIHAEADECWALGELTVTIDGRAVTRQQFGSQKVKRSRSSGTPLDIGFDLKGAATDALKKCASLIGVALYLWKKEPPSGLGNGGVPTNGAGQNGSNGSYGGGNPNGMHVVGGTGSNTGAGGGADLDALFCEECGEPLTETRFKDGTNWAPAQLAVFGRRKHSRILCMSHYREANQAKRRAEEALQQVPF